MSNVWVVVGNGSAVRIFTNDKKQSLIELSNLVHPASRLGGKQLKTDREGRRSAGYRRNKGSAQESQVTPHHHELQMFARQVAHYLDDAAQRGEFQRLYLMLPPVFLGLLRPSLGALTHQKIVEQECKNVMQKGLQEIRKHLPYVL